MLAITATEWFQWMEKHDDNDLEIVRMLFVQLQRRPSQHDIETVLAFITAIRLRLVKHLEEKQA